MKQGAGRLLRDENDYGVIVLCDPRITSKSYGRMFLKSFEPMPSTSSIDDVAQFLLRTSARGPWHEAAGAGYVFDRVFGRAAAW